MDEISDLIRLLAEAPMEEPPMSRPKDLLDRISLERVVSEGVQPLGNAVPEASPTNTSKEVGAVANPKTGMPDIPVQVSVSQLETIPGRPAVPNKTEVVAGRTVNPKPQQPMKVGEARVFSPETVTGRVATPKILDTIAGLPASMKDRQSTTGQAQVTPRAQVTVTVPPNFPLDPKEIFSVVDDLIQLPPRQDVSGARDLRAPMSTSNLESTEAFVARSFRANEGNTSDLDRWHL
jgi:hypothetical protein